jgi:hypothetical protein
MIVGRERQPGGEHPPDAARGQQALALHEQAAAQGGLVDRQAVVEVGRRRDRHARRDLLGVSRGCTIGAAGLHHPQLAREVEIEGHGSLLVGTDGIFKPLCAGTGLRTISVTQRRELSLPFEQTAAKRRFCETQAGLLS